MKVLILNEFDDKTPFMKELSENLRLKNFEVNILDLKKHRLIRYFPENDGFLVDNTVTSSFIHSVIRLRAINVIFKLVYYNWIYELPSYTHLSYHYVGSIYLFFHRKLTKKGKIMSSAILWGSDFYRVNSFDRALKKRLYRKVDFVGIGNPIMKKHFLKQNPGIEPKVMKVVFGIKKLTDIKKVKSSISVERLKEKWDIANDKRVITIGYNGRRQQQHIEVLKNLEHFLKSQSDKIHIFIPYGNLGKESYKEEILRSLKRLNVSYTIVDWFCSDEEVAEYRVITDIAINAQTTDAMAASIQEHFYAGSVLFTGDWLPYQYFKDLGLIFSTFDWNDIHEKFLSIFKNVEEKKRSLKTNEDIIWSHSAWPATITGWEKLYQSNSYEGIVE